MSLSNAGPNYPEEHSFFLSQYLFAPQFFPPSWAGEAADGEPLHLLSKSGLLTGNWELGLFIL